MCHEGHGHGALEQLLDEGFDDHPAQGHAEAAVGHGLHGVLAEGELVEGGGGVVDEYAVVQLGGDGAVEEVELVEDFVVFFE